MKIWIGYEDMDRSLTYPDAHNLSGFEQPIRVTDPRRAAAVSQRAHDSARLPIYVACNSHVNLLIFEVGSLKFRGFQGVIQETRWGITCEMRGGPSAGSPVSAATPHPSARSSCRHHLDNRIDGTSPASTQRLSTPPRRPARTRIGYKDADRLLSYPDAHNLSAS